jgi:uncharacterized protein
METASLCARHHEISAVILESPHGDTQPQVLHDIRTHLIPVRLLFHEQFPLAVPLQSLSTPKLILTFQDAKDPPDLHTAALPKMTVELRSETDVGKLPETIGRFLDSYALNL